MFPVTIEQGWYVYTRSDGRLRFGVSDNTTGIATNVGTTDVTDASGVGAYNSYIIQFDLETPGSETIYVYPNGYDESAAVWSYDISSLTFPITADNDFGIGSRTGASANLPINGDIMVGMGQGILTAEQRWFLNNHYRGRTYAEVADKDYLDFVKYAQAGIPATNQFFFSARTDRPVVPKVYDLSGTLVATGSSVTPVEGYVNGIVTGKPAWAYLTKTR